MEWTANTSQEDKRVEMRNLQTDVTELKILVGEMESSLETNHNQNKNR